MTDARTPSYLIRQAEIIQKTLPICLQELNAYCDSDDLYHQSKHPPIEKIVDQFLPKLNECLRGIDDKQVRQALLTLAETALNGLSLIVIAIVSGSQYHVTIAKQNMETPEQSAKRNTIIRYLNAVLTFHDEHFNKNNPSDIIKNAFGPCQSSIKVY